MNLNPNNHIIWHKWEDPMAHMVFDRDAEFFDPDGPYADAHARESSDSFVQPGEPYHNVTTPKQKDTGPAIMGPMGLIPIHESNLPGFLYNFWMGHANFDLTEEMVELIEEAEGVETIDVFTRYRFRMSVGKHFDQDEVKRNVDRAVVPKPKPKKVLVKGLEIIQRDLSKDHPYWAIYRMKNRQLRTCGGQSVEEVQKQGAQYRDAAEEIILSWESQ